MKRKVLVTGAAGRIGKATAEALLKRGHLVRALDRVPSPFASENVVGDIADFDTVSRAVHGMDTIIHLAATPDDDDFMTQLLPNNIIPIHHILEAARLNKVPRIMLASTGQVIWQQQHHGPYPIPAEVSHTPRYWYAVTKIFAEYAGKIFAETHQLDVLAVRLGACPRDRAAVDIIGSHEITRDVYVSPADAARFYTLAVEAKPGFGFQIVYVCSKPIFRHIFDPEPARRLCGYEPRDRWPEGLPPEIIGDAPIPGSPT